MRRHIVFILGAVIFLSSCSKNNSSPVQTPVVEEKVTDYFPLTVGNYWVYQLFRADTSMVPVPNGYFDSTYVEKDTVVNGKSFKKVISGYLFEYWLLRDSADFLVNELGQRQFTHRQFTATLYDYQPDYATGFVVSAAMSQKDSTFIVPAGQFVSKYLVGSVTALGDVPAWQKHRSFSIAYSKNIGPVHRWAVWVHSPEFLEWRLVRFSVKNTTL